MKEKLTTKDILMIIFILLGFYGLLQLTDKPQVQEPLPPIPPEKEVRGIDYQTSVNGIVQWKYYTDDEIRYLRETNPYLIIKVPGRRIISREAQFEEDIEEYLQAHPELLEDDY